MFDFNEIGTSCMFGQINCTVFTYTINEYTLADAIKHLRYDPFRATLDIENTT